MTNHNLMGEPPATFLPPDPAAQRLAAGDSPGDVARAYPTSSLAWAVLAEHALDAAADVEGYAYARTGYHRALDALRRNGWKGHGPVPWKHEANRGFLRSLAALTRAAAAIGEVEEEHRCREFLRESSREAYDVLLGA